MSKHLTLKEIASLTTFRTSFQITLQMNGCQDCETRVQTERSTARIIDEAGTAFSRKDPSSQHLHPGSQGRTGAQVCSMPLCALTARLPSPCWSHSLPSLYVRGLGEAAGSRVKTWAEAGCPVRGPTLTLSCIDCCQAINLH